ncbi:MAG TPA: hypothetical protein VJB98_03040 [Candidatus Paceibacterota bacterium]
MRKGSLTILTLSSAILLSAWVYLFMYINRQSADLSGQYEALAQENEKETTVKALSRDLRETEEARVVLDSFIVRQGQEAEFLERVEGLAAKATVVLKVFKFETREDSLYLNFQSSGSFQSNYYFLGLLESVPYNLSFGQVSLEKEELNREEAWVGKHEVTVSSYMRETKP